MKLTKRDKNSYYVNKRKKFNGILIDKKFLDESFDFSYSMVYGEGHHRNHRSGGQYERNKGELFANTFQGKLAEFITHDLLKKAGLTDLKDVDTSIHGIGIWDDADIQYKDKKINIKSAAFFSSLLLLETKDWDCNGEYIPNLDSESTNKYDYFILIRIMPDFKTILKKENLFYSDKIEKEKLNVLINSQEWYYDFGGACSKKTVQYIIKKNYLLPQNSLLNGKTPMDAENYYIQVGDLKNIDFIIDELSEL